MHTLTVEIFLTPEKILQFDFAYVHKHNVHHYEVGEVIGDLVLRNLNGRRHGYNFTFEKHGRFFKRGFFKDGVAVQPPQPPQSQQLPPPQYS